MLTTTQIQKPYPTKEDRRWFPIFTGDPFPCPHEPNLTYGPLLKVKITYVASTNSSVVSFGFCHAVMDATSVGVFLQMLQAHYNDSDTSSNDGSETTPEMSLERVENLTLPERSNEPLDLFTLLTLLKAAPKVLRPVKHINLTLEIAELQRLKADFVQALEGEL